jgi:hypothetical protein
MLHLTVSYVEVYQQIIQDIKTQKLSDHFCSREMFMERTGRKVLPQRG